MPLDWGWGPWLLLGALAFFAAGWIAARFDVRQLLRESKVLPQSYFRGLNFLLNEQQDKAIEAFIEATNANPEAIELQFALGSLFRRRGEVDRSIRVHQSLSERSDINAEQRVTALIELSMDYQKSGLLDYAEKILSDIGAKGSGTVPQQAQTLKLLLDIYVQENDWKKAIDVAEQLIAGLAGDASKLRQHKAMTKEIAHYYCELAADEYAKASAKSHGQIQAQNQSEDYALAERALSAALNTDPQCVRVHLMRGEWLQAAGQHEAAIAEWQKIEVQDPTYLGLMAEKLLASYDALGRGAEGLAHLRELQRQYAALDLLNAIFTATMASAGPQAAYELVKEDLRTNPTLVGLDRLLEAQILAAPDDRKKDLTMLKALVHSHSSRLAVYLCKQCGFKAKQFYWHCPACGGWETFPPRRTAEYDSAERHLARSHVEG